MRVALFALLVLLNVTSASLLAHPGDKGFATITVSGASVQIAYTLPLSSIHLEAAKTAGLPNVTSDANFRPLANIVERLIAVGADGQSCKSDPGVLTPPADERGSIAILLRYECGRDTPKILRIRNDLGDLLGSDYVTLANIQWPGGSRQFVFRRDAPEATIEPFKRGATLGAFGFFTLGIEHIIAGWDHLLFLFCLLLLGGRFIDLIKIVTAFTVAHSITLVAAALDVVAIPSRIVESAIALSIAYVAAENIFLRGHAASKRWLVAIVFGFVHGFGFSAVLKELGLPTDGLVLALLAFNLGVEFGQAFVVALALPVLLYLTRTTWHARAIGAASGVMLALGLGLFVDRAFF
ncbi:MAG: HupE/UreJ family protein [Burkholderiales bacterium]